MSSPAPLTEVMLPGSRSTTLARASKVLRPSCPTIRLPSGARTMPPWRTVPPPSASVPNADCGMATSPST
ncbi:hypothetical protein D9M69_518190 [compost metagenome]